MVLSSTTLVATTPRTASRSGRTWTLRPTSTASSPRSTPSVRPLRSGTQATSSAMSMKASSPFLVVSSWWLLPTTEAPNSVRSPTIHSMKVTWSATFSTPLRTARKSVEVLMFTWLTESQRSTSLSPSSLLSSQLSPSSSSDYQIISICLVEVNYSHKYIYQSEYQSTQIINACCQTFNLILNMEMSA